VTNPAKPYHFETPLRRSVKIQTDFIQRQLVGEHNAAGRMWSILLRAALFFEQDARKATEEISRVHHEALESERPLDGLDVGKGQGNLVGLSIHQELPRIVR